MFFESFHSITEEFCVSFGESISFPLHLHRSFEFFVQAEGETEVSIDEKVYHLCAGEAVLVFPFQTHSYHCKTAGKYEIIIFSPEIVMNFYMQTKNLLPVNHQFRCEPIAIDGTDNIFLKKASAYQICGMFENGRLYEKTTDEPRHTVLVKLLLYANEHFREKCLLKDVCAAIGYDYAYISKFFKRNVGMSFRKYVNMLRIRESQHLLKTSLKGITEIAHESGFCSLRDFDRNFVLFVGCTPTEYRKSINW